MTSVVAFEFPAVSNFYKSLRCYNYSRFKIVFCALCEKDVIIWT